MKQIYFTRTEESTKLTPLLLCGWDKTAYLCDQWKKYSHYLIQYCLLELQEVVIRQYFSLLENKSQRMETVKRKGHSTVF